MFEKGAMFKKKPRKCPRPPTHKKSSPERELLWAKGKFPFAISIWMIEKRARLGVFHGLEFFLKRRNLLFCLEFEFFALLLGDLIFG